ncbi:ComEC/Rec2 family competence protein [Actinomyces sp. B33]|uniref:ComEC/Rec2 family competence protein n=1 Tax=Actinomyces sp. B33 TaxID=2942131 RepID=UPI002340E607|nr:ComEC/Rec2 family competence protein [Actinomyces sp. B33]MDC4232817.1 ComEC/Rec2 family competence protein [Actinomyces sp. B33]
MTPPRPVPDMIDLRLVPAACLGWAASWTTTSPLVDGRASLWIGACLAVVCLVLCAWATAGRGPRGGAHALTPGGSVRMAAALACAVALCCALTGAAARARHDADPAVVAAAGGGGLDLLVELAGDPAPGGRPIDASFFSADARVFAVVDGSGLRRPSRALVRIRARDWGPYARGDRLRVRGRVDPSFHSDAPFIGELRAQAETLIERPQGWESWARATRSGLVRACAGLPDQGRALVAGMAVGDDRAMTGDLATAMRRTSLTHLVAVSGSHIAVVLGAVTHLLPSRRAWRAPATLVVLAGVVALVGPEPSVLRSVAVAAVGVAGLALGRAGQSMTALAAVVVAALVWSPWASRSVGFALSVGATAGVVGPAARLTAWADARLRDDTAPGRACRRLVGLIAVPVCAQGCVLPILLALDNRAPVWSVLANVLAGPAVAPATILALACALVSPVAPGAAESLAGIASLFTGWVAGVARTLAEWPGAEVEVPGGPAGALAGYAAAAVLVLVGSATRRRRRAAERRRRAEP